MKSLSVKAQLRHQEKYRTRKRAAADLRHQNERFATLQTITLDLLNHHNVDEVLSSIVRQASELLEAPICMLDLLDGETLVIQAATETAQTFKGQRVPLQSAHLTERAIQTRQPQFVENYASREDRVKIFDPHQMRAACTFPIIINDQAVGALSLGRTQPDRPFLPEGVEIMRSLAQLAALAIDNANLFEETRKRSITDSLTGLANRRHFDAVLEQEWKRALRDKTPVALILLDIDSFKKYNDTYGHGMGDDCLKQIAQVLEKAARRAYDLSARYGGEEFVLILPSTNQAGAKRRAKTLRKDVEALHIPHQSSEVEPWVTISLGVAAMVPSLKNDVAKLVSAADGALYKAKRDGKNQVATSSMKGVSRSA